MSSENKGMCHSEITMDEFELSKVKQMGIDEAKRYIDKHFIILDNGDHAMINKGRVIMYDTKTINSLYFNRLSNELKNYYHKDKTDIRTIICDIHKPFLTSTELNVSEKLKHKYVPYNSFSKEVREKVNIMLAYMKEVLCAGREDILNHLLKMEAKMVRGEKNDACIYLKGAQGIGKSTHPEFLRMFVMGKGLSIETGSGPLKNKFNSELKGKVMTIFEELENFGSAEWMAISSTLKRWITSGTMQIEGKNKDVIEVVNIITFWLLSNNDAIQDDDGRRYFILPVSVKYMEDHNYFGNLRNNCFNDEVGHAYYCMLMELDIKGFNSQAYPVTSAKLDSQEKRLDNVYKFIKEIFILHKIGIKRITVQRLYDKYVDYCTDHKISKPKSKHEFNNTLENVGICYYKSDGKNVYSKSYEDLEIVAKKRHWIHELDEYFNRDDEDGDYDYGIDKSDKSVDIALEWQNKFVEMEQKYNNLLAEFEKHKSVPIVEKSKPKPKSMKMIITEDKVKAPKKKLKSIPIPDDSEDDDQEINDIDLENAIDNMKIFA